MVDNIRFNTILPSPTSTQKVTRPDSKGRNNRQTPFKESLDRKQKKKKKDESEDATQPESRIAIGAGTRKTPDEAKQSPRSKLIDIRV